VAPPFSSPRPFFFLSIVHEKTFINLHLTLRSCMKRSFNCGENHSRGLCKFTFQTVVSGRGCPYCLDLCSRQGYVSHSKTNCPLQCRLKRLIFEDYFKSGRRGRIVAFVTPITCSTDSFYRYLASHCKK
jgi:hypothetical protein